MVGGEGRRGFGGSEEGKEEGDGCAVMMVREEFLLHVGVQDCLSVVE